MLSELSEVCMPLQTYSRMCCNVCKATGANKDGSQMIVPIKDRVYPSCLRRGRLPTVVTMGPVLPVPRENPAYSSPTTQVEAMAKDLCHKTTGLHLGLPDKHLHGMTSQCQASRLPLHERTDAQSQWHQTHVSGKIGLILLRVIFFFLFPT